MESVFKTLQGAQGGWHVVDRRKKTGEVARSLNLTVLKRSEVLRLPGEVTNGGTDTIRVGAGAKARAL